MTIYMFQNDDSVVAIVTSTCSVGFSRRLAMMHTMK